MSKKIEDVINGTLKDNAQRNALDFIVHLRKDEGFSFSKDENDDGRWWVNYKGNFLCEIQIGVSGDAPAGWEMWFYGDNIGGLDSMVDEDIKKIAWANITLCGNCGADCAPGRRKTVFGKEFDNVCQSTLAFPNPGIEMLECMKIIADAMLPNRCHVR
jgi:hypothetical protein